jgi:hypothetical protein
MKKIYSTLVLASLLAVPAFAGISDEFFVEGVVVSILPKEIRVANSGTVMIVPKALIPKDTRVSANAPISIALGWEFANQVKTARTPASLSEADAVKTKR